MSSEPKAVTEAQQVTARQAILDAATKLFSERSPSTVSLREVACLAGVNYGLIHHYFGTKEALLADVFAGFSERSARQLDEVTTIEEAVRLFAPVHRAGPQTNMLAWAILDGATSEGFRRSPAIERIRELIEAEWSSTNTVPSDHKTFDSRVVAATVIAMIQSWRFFEPFLRPAAALTELDPDEIASQVVDLTMALVRGAAPEGRLTDPR